MKKALITYSLLLIALIGFTQTPKKATQLYDDAIAYAKKTQYTEAIATLQQAIKIYPAYLDAKILIGELYFAQRKYNEAIPYFEAAKTDAQTVYTDIQQNRLYWMLADCYYLTEQHDKAIAISNLYLKQNKISEFGKQKVNDIISKASFSISAKKNPVSFNPINLGENVNSADDEYFPALTPDGSELFFTRRIFNQEDIYHSQYTSSWSPAEILSNQINDPTHNDGSQSISANGNLLFFTTCNRNNVFGSCDIFYSYNDGKNWTTAKGINKPINTPYWDAQPSFAANGNAMYFSSDRPGGFGGRDIWVSYLDDQLRWSEPKNLGAVINTPQDDQTPFIHPDGVTLYFASNGHQGMGQNDLFITTLENGQWTIPKNLGYPINTEKDEMGLFVSTDGTTAYFASNRVGGFGKLDIYSFDLPNAYKPKPTTFVKVQVYDAISKQALFADYALLDLAKNETVTSGKTNGNGNFVACLTANKNYALTVQKDKYLFHSENFSFSSSSAVEPYILNVYLQPIQKDNIIQLNNVFFDIDKAELKSTSFPELDKVVALLKENPNLKVEIGGHTDNTGNADYNLLLSKRRAESVVQYLVGKGIALNRLTAKGYGMTKPLVDNTNEQNKAQNRRTELKILE
ncbi:MAG: PD40 domain-containing protein [Chitinophagales bacterium]|nr:PD40 domain-containing protein [Chitinophagales bacterium]